MSADARRVEPEWLDGLDPLDPRAERSRRDIARVNALMSNAGIVARALARSFPAGLGAWAEIGAGDGRFAAEVARLLPAARDDARVVLVDRAPAATADARQALAARGWSSSIAAADVFDWLADRQTPRVEAIVANLFLHHFEDAALHRLLALAAQRCRVFVACEPRRSAIALLGSRLLGVVGCGEVTRHDAVVSVRAGFRDGEIAAAWPRDDRWRLEEAARGLFSHAFVAERE